MRGSMPEIWIVGFVGVRVLVLALMREQVGVTRLHCTRL